MAALYRLTAGANILRTTDGAYIPPDPHNGDYEAYLAWVAAGNTPDPVPPPPAPSAESVIADSAQSRLLAQAKTALAAGDTTTAITLLLQHLEGSS